MGKLTIPRHEDPVINMFMLLKVIADVSMKQLERHHRELNLSLVHNTVLGLLTLNGGKAKHSDIAKWTNTGKHNITALIERMKSEQLVTTERSKTDKRVIYVFITDKGRGTHEIVRPLETRMIHKFMDGISERDVRHTMKILNIIKDNLEHD